MRAATIACYRISWIPRACVAGLLLLADVLPADAQSSSATLSGTVVDSTGAALPGAHVVVVNVATTAERATETSRDGAFVLAALPAARYTLRASLPNFNVAELRDIVLNVDDRVSVRVELSVASRGEDVTVVGEAQRLSTSPAVSTVVDRQFVENLPLNGRSLQSLLELTPGVVLTPTGTGQGGQFSVNGQRTNANYVTIDGVSANVGLVGIPAGTGGPGQSGSGQLPALTALGGTNGLVSIDALQEFRIQTSTYAPEFGRMPGGQVSMITRAGTNALHGSVFEYFRDEALDATDWFTNNRGLTKPQLRQHAFGGVAGGPLTRGRAFFFASYEGLRLMEPRAVVKTVPTIAARRAAPLAVQPYLDALPIPNGPDRGNGSAEFAASYSDPSRFDATSVRVDYNATGRLTLFGRAGYSPSHSTQRAGSLSFTNTTHQNNGSATAGATWIHSPRFVYDLRVNLSGGSAPYTQEPDTFGGAAMPPSAVFAPGRGFDNALTDFIAFGGGDWSWGSGVPIESRQINTVGSLSVTGKSHLVKFGLDFRRIDTQMANGDLGRETLTFDVPNNRVSNYQILANDSVKRTARFDNLSLYIQDTWVANHRLTLTHGLRWEFVPPPRASEGANPVALDGLESSLSGSVHLAPRDTPLWETRYGNVAPRVGASYLLSDKQEAQLLIRGGFGMFHDLGFGQVASSFRTYPFQAIKVVQGPALPLTADDRRPPDLLEGPPQQISVMDRRLRLPFTYQWNVSAEQSLGARQTITISYVGAEGRRLLKSERYRIPLMEWPNVRTNVSIARNRASSDHRSMQVQYQRRLDHGLQAVASYTLSRSRDTESNDSGIRESTQALPSDVDYGYSDYDVRHVFTAAVTYQMSKASNSSLWRRVASDWGTDLMVRARSGFPMDIRTSVPFDGLGNLSVRPNVVVGAPFWIDDPDAPGGRRLNSQAFAHPPPNTVGDISRGAVRGFVVRQVDLALRRQFGLAGGLRIQLRVEMFNLLNTSHFADPESNLRNRNFGLSSQTLSRALGGLNSLYQSGGPRSTQVAIKILF